MTIAPLRRLQACNAAGCRYGLESTEGILAGPPTGSSQERGPSERRTEFNRGIVNPEFRLNARERGRTNSRRDTTTTMITDRIKSPEQFPDVFASRFQRADIDALLAGYTEDAVMNLGGKIFTGHAEIRDAIASLLAPKLPIRTHLRSWAASGGTALVIFDWAIDGEAPDGKAIHIEGRAVDVLVIGTDGAWRQILDFPFGTAGEPK